MLFLGSDIVDILSIKEVFSFNKIYQKINGNLIKRLLLRQIWIRYVNQQLSNLYTFRSTIENLGIR